MNFTSQICTTEEQSKRLLALGLKRETADMVLLKELAYDDKRHCLYDADTYMIRPIDYLNGEDHRGNIPAWSLHRLLCLLPTEYIADIDFQQVMQDFVFRSQDMYDEVISCIETLIKEGYFYKEYLSK
jgi:hypothetical protein